jgi:hypothetical protein
MACDSQPVIDGFAYMSAGVTALVVTREVVREHEVTAAPSNLDSGPEL